MSGTFSLLRIRRPAVFWSFRELHGLEGKPGPIAVRTLADALVASAHSDAARGSPSWPRLAATPAPEARAAPS